MQGKWKSSASLFHYKWKLLFSSDYSVHYKNTVPSSGLIFTHSPMQRENLIAVHRSSTGFLSEAVRERQTLNFILCVCLRSQNLWPIPVFDHPSMMLSCHSKAVISCYHIPGCGIGCCHEAEEALLLLYNRIQQTSVVTNNTRCTINSKLPKNKD